MDGRLRLKDDLTVWPTGRRHRVASEEGGHEHGVLRGAASGACPASSPAAGGDDAEATERNFANRLHWKVEGTKRNIPASLIEEWLGLGLATVGGPTATTSAYSEQGSAIPHLKEQRGSSGEGEGACARRGLGGQIGRAHV